MQFDVEAVESIISSSPRRNGCFNLFFKLNDKIGIKLSGSKEQRDTLYKNQTNASKFGLGPDTYGTIDNVEYRGKTYWGYFTEIVWVMDICPKDRFEKGLLYKSIKTEEIDLCEALREKCNYDFYDCHLGNIGVKDGQLVCIDFDTEDSSCHNFRQYC